MARPLEVSRVVHDVALHRVASAIADPVRAQILLALIDGRALPASTLATEAGISASTASAHLSQLVGARLLAVEPHGRFRYYRIVNAKVVEVLEALAALAGQPAIRSMKVGTREHRLRTARTCYHHLAGRLGVAIMQSLLLRGFLVGHDGSFDASTAVNDRLSAPGSDIVYRLSDSGRQFFEQLGIAGADLDAVDPLKYCVDWSEQQHHLSGSLGSLLQRRLEELGWIVRAPDCRAVNVTQAGRDALAEQFGIGPGFSVTLPDQTSRQVPSQTSR